MGQFSVVVEMSHPMKHEFWEVRAVVDTGATYSVFPRLLMETLGIEPIGKELFTLADGQTTMGDIAEARFRIGEKERVAMVGFALDDRDDKTYLLGAHTLQAFALIPDTSQHRLIPATLLLVGIRMGIISGEPLRYKPHFHA